MTAEIERLLEAVRNNPYDDKAAAELLAEVKVLQEWKDRLVDEAVVSWVLSESNKDDPKKMINDIICWHVQVALDPAVSETAAKWVEQIKAKDEEIARLKDSMMRHFNEEHLAGDGPEISRWKSRNQWLEQRNAELRAARVKFVEVLQSSHFSALEKELIMKMWTAHSG